MNWHDDDCDGCTRSDCSLRGCVASVPRTPVGAPAQWLNVVTPPPIRAARLSAWTVTAEERAGRAATTEEQKR